MSNVIDAQLQAALEDLTAALPRQPGRLAQWREAVNRHCEPLPAVASIKEVSIPVEKGMIPLRLFIPLGSNPPYAAHIFYPAGGFFPGDLATAEGWCREVCAGVGCIVVCVGYRVPTKFTTAYRCPTPGRDGYAALRWVALHAAEYGMDVHRISIGGESLGATVAALSAAMAARQGGPVLRFQVLEMPAADFTLEDDAAHYPSLTLYGARHLLTYQALRSFKKLYLASPPQGYKGQASPIFAENLAHLPPTLLTTAAYDPLRDEGEAYGRLLWGAGVPVVTKRWPLFHGAGHLTALPAAQDYRDMVISTLRRAYGLLLAGHASAPAHAR
ncbi:MAG TPA: alpha/beta hydrolase fold domain-containing protein [Ktedonobacterales bacterium]|nr:alpha/beta hydrolase fold domain-containing protein [Ktedonobacterales bacterium]